MTEPVRLQHFKLNARTYKIYFNRRIVSEIRAPRRYSSYQAAIIDLLNNNSRNYCTKKDIKIENGNLFLVLKVFLFFYKFK